MKTYQAIYNDFKEYKFFYTIFLIGIFALNFMQILNPFLAFDESYVYSFKFNPTIDHFLYRAYWEIRPIYGFIQYIINIIKPNPSFLLILGLIGYWVEGILFLNIFKMIFKININFTLRLLFLLLFYINFALYNHLAYPSQFIACIFVSIFLYCFIDFFSKDSIKILDYIVYIVASSIIALWFSTYFYLLACLLFFHYLYTFYKKDYNIKNYFLYLKNYLILGITPIVILILILAILKHTYHLMSLLHTGKDWRHQEFSSFMFYIKYIIYSLPNCLSLGYIISLVLILNFYKNSFKSLFLAFIVIVISTSIGLASDLFLHKAGSIARLIVFYMYVDCLIIYSLFLYKNKFIGKIAYIIFFVIALINLSNGMLDAQFRYLKQQALNNDILQIKKTYLALCPDEKCSLVLYGIKPFENSVLEKISKNYLQVELDKYRSKSNFDTHNFMFYPWNLADNFSYYGLNVEQTLQFNDLQQIAKTNLGKSILSYISLNKDHPVVGGALKVEDEDHNQIVVVLVIS